MSTTVEKRQTEMAGMPQTALGRYANDYCDQKGRVKEAKDKLDKIGVDIVRVMHKENRRFFTINYEGQRVRFEVVAGNEKLKCVRASEASA